MPNYNVKQFFTFKSVTPRSVQPGNLIQFSYHNPEGDIHDRNPLIYVTSRDRERIWGFNVHYNSNQLAEIIDNTNNNIDYILEKEWLKKDKKNRQRLAEADGEFNRGFIEKKDFNTITRRVPKNQLEQFALEDTDIDTLRQYLLIRMNAVSKCVYKINQ